MNTKSSDFPEGYYKELLKNKVEAARQGLLFETKRLKCYEERGFLHNGGFYASLGQSKNNDKIIELNGIYSRRNEAEKNIRRLGMIKPARDWKKQLKKIIEGEETSYESYD